MSDLLNSASLVMIPSGYAEDKVYSVVPSDGSGDLSFTRSSNGTRVNSAGLVEVCPSNLYTYSEVLSNSIWANGNATITDNTTNAPNGTATADSIFEQAINDYQIRGQNFSMVSGQVFTFSIYAKANTRNFFRILVGNGVLLSNQSAYFDLVNVTTTSTSSITSSIESVGNGWYKIVILFTCNNTGTDAIYYGPSPNMTSGYLSFVGNASNGVFIWGAQLNIGALKPYFPTTDRLNVPRLTYQNGGGGCPSLLLEKQSTNLVTYSEQFDNAAWTKGSVTITANTAISPDGTTNADSVVDTATNAEHNINQTTTITSNVASTFSVYLKSGTQPFAMLRHYGAAGEQYFCVVVNLNTGVITKTQAGTDTSATSSSITNVGNGWYRVTATCVFASTTAIPILQLVNSATPTIGNFGNNAYTGNGTNSILAWGFQFEQSSYPTSYIPTTSSSATRVADACFKAGISSLIGQSEGFIAGEVEGLTNSYGSQSTIMSVSDGTTANRIMFSFNASTGYVTPRIFKAGSTIFVNDFSITLTQKIKFAIGWGGGRAVCYVNGTQVQQTTGLTFFSSGTLTRFGADDGAGSNIGIGKVSEYILGTANLTNAQLQSLTL